VAAAANGGSVFSETNQDNYHVSEMIDGTVTGNSNGWAFDGGASRASPRIAVVQFAEAATIDTIHILSGIERSDHHVTGIAMWYTTTEGATTESSDWQPLSRLTFLVDVPGGAVGGSSGNELTVNGQHDLPVVFTPVLATALKIDIFDTDAGNENVVLTELFIYSGSAPASGACPDDGKLRHGESCGVTCHDGFEMHDPSPTDDGFRTCNAGVLSGTTCGDDFCDTSELQSIIGSHGQHDCGVSVEIGAECTLTCNVGYFAAGSEPPPQSLSGPTVTVTPMTCGSGGSLMLVVDGSVTPTAACIGRPCFPSRPQPLVIVHQLLHSCGDGYESRLEHGETCQLIPGRATLQPAAAT
jgi:hypothetical protein